jgi:hypothetical protein
MKHNFSTLFKVFMLGVILIGSLNSNAQRICGSMDYLNSQIQSDPNIVQRRQIIETQTQSYQSALNKAAGVLVTIPVVVHVVYNTSTQNISQAQIQSQIDILNADYRKLNADTANVPTLFKSIAADCKIEFVLAKRDPAGNATNGIVRKQTATTSFSSNDNVKYSSKGGDDAWASGSYLNLWVCPLGGGLLGYAQFPGSGSALTDGVVVNVTAFGNTGTAAAPFNKGRTATHEVGHWLNLYHIWGDDSGACTGSDNVGDTPNQGAENYGCPIYPRASCSNTSDMFMNYMDYVDDACMNMFSVGQGSRMSALFASGGARASLLTSLGGIAPGTGTACALPTGLSASSITSNSATINWTPVSGATSYNVQYKTATNAAFITVSSATNTLNLSGLNANSFYTYQIQTVCSGGVSAYTPISNFTTLAVTNCAIPAGLTASSITSSAATISWAAVSGATSYLLQYKTNAAAAFTSISSYTNSISLTGLSATTVYSYQVKTVCSNTLSSAFSTVGAFTTTASTACAVPTGIAASGITSNRAVISWAAVSGSNGYKVQYKTTNATTYSSFTTTTNTITLTGLSAATGYTYQVQTVCSNTLSSSWSSAAAFATLAASTCAIPSGISVSGITASAATISWTAVTGALSYKLQYKSSAAATFTAVTSNTNSISLTGLTASTVYTYQVQTVCSGALSSALSAASTFATSAAASCATPSGISISGISASAATVKWTAVSGAASYKVQYKTSAAPAFTTITSTSASANITGLAASTAYTYQVQTVCSNGLSSALTTASTFTTSAATSCASPTGASVSSVTANSASITWTSVSGAQSYKLQYKATTANAFTVVTSATNTYLLNGLTPGVTYSYQIQTVCSSSLLSPVTTAANFTTLSSSACTDNYEANETRTTAKAIPAGVSITAKIGTSTDIDWFSINNTSAAKNIQVVLNNLPADYDLYLYSSTGALLASSLNAGNSSETLKYNNGAVGTYYIRIIGYNGVFSAVNCYSLIANTSSVAYRMSAPQTSKTESNYNIFPNPAQNEVNVDFTLSSNKTVEVRVYDITGKLVISNTFEGVEGLNKNVLDISGLINKGIYMLECNDGDKVQISKLIIEK